MRGRAWLGGRGWLMCGLVLVTGIGCSSPTGPSPPRWWYTDGEVEEVEEGRFLINLALGDPCGIWFTTSAETEYAERVPGVGWRTATRAVLEVGALVRVWIREDDGIRESCPGQGDAIWVEILEGGAGEG